MIATGTPEEVAGAERSYTGEFLRHVLGEGEAPAEPRRRNARAVAGRKKGWYNGLRGRKAVAGKRATRHKV